MSGNVSPASLFSTVCQSGIRVSSVLVTDYSVVEISVILSIPVSGRHLSVFLTHNLPSWNVWSGSVSSCESCNFAAITRNSRPTLFLFSWCKKNFLNFVPCIGIYLSLFPLSLVAECSTAPSVCSEENTVHKIENYRTVVNHTGHFTHSWGGGGSGI